LAGRWKGLTIAAFLQTSAPRKGPVDLHFAGNRSFRSPKVKPLNVAASAVTLNAGILALTRGSPLNGIEPLLAVFFILLIAAGSTAVLWDLQDHLLRVRGDLDLYGSSPWHRATDVFYPLTVIIALSAIVMLYLLRFPHLPQCP